MNAVTFSAGGKVIAVGGSNGSTYLWDASGHTLSATLTGPAGTKVWSVAFSPDGRTLAGGDDSGHVFLWRIG